MSKKYFSNEIIIGISAMIISLSTLLVFIYQTNLIKRQQYKSVYPHLNIVNMNSGSVNYEYVLRNQGIGPAFITSIEVTDASGQSYNSLVDYANHKIVAKDSVDFSYWDIFPGTVIQEKERIPLLKLSDNAQRKHKAKEAVRLREILVSDSLRLRISYESIYGESWTMRNGSNTPVKN